MVKPPYTHPHCQLLGVHINILRWADILNIVGWHISDGQQITLSYANAHTLNLAVEDAAIKNLLNRSDITYCDGNGVRWAAQYHGINIPERHTGADWIWKLGQAASAQDWSVYWLGNPPGMTEYASQRLKRHFPNLRIHHDHGYHKKTGSENTAVLERIRKAQPDILLVGMGTPTQESWIHQNKDALSMVPVLWALGAAAEFVAQPQTRNGPRWMLNHLEWLNRLISDPKRMWRRYLLGNPKFVWRVLKDK